MIKNFKNSREKSVVRGMLFHLIILIFILVIAFSGIEYLFYSLFKRSFTFNPLLGLSTIIPKSAILGFISYLGLKKQNMYFETLIKAINRVAAGDFNTTIKLEKTGGFCKVFENFNKMSRELKEVQTLREDFINQFSHEFKTPIMSINGFANIMIEEELSREEQVQYLKIIESESKRLGELSKNTLLMAKLESQELVLDKEIFSLDNQIKEVIIMLEYYWHKKNQSLDIKMEDALFSGNIEIMKQLWINLIGNAIKYCPVNGKIAISLKKIKSFYTIIIKNSGEKINSADLPLLFNKYYKGNSQIAADGLGLGLSIAKKIVDLCEGSIRLESDNTGTTTIVELPVNI